jgi:uncharacterized membrane protein YphA (DoxX/SURF4 family)
MMATRNGLSRTQSVFLVLLRIFVGWHLLYEGIAKMLIPEWTSAAYLENSRWIFSGLFHSLASSEGALQVVDFLNVWGLTLIGLALLLGLLSRYASIAGMALLSLYYVANPPFIGTDFGIPLEGHYLFINKTFVEIIALGLLAVFPSGLYFGIDRFIRASGNARRAPSADRPESEKKSGNSLDDNAVPDSLHRREILRYLAMVPVLGAFAWGTVRKYRWSSVNAISGATIKVSDSKLKDLKGELPRGKILDRQVSRIFIGGNLIGGWSHSRDLIYVSSLFKAYNTERKVFETLALAENAGINAINISHMQLPLINKYKRIFDSSLQTMTQVHPTKDKLYDDINSVIDQGVDLIQIQGNCCDWRVRDGEIDVLAKSLDYIKKQGYPAGMGAHSVQALMACDEAGIEPDFFMKTFHHDKYWSAHPVEKRIPFSVDGDRSSNHDEFHDNMFCLFPEQTVEFMNKKKIPWIAFKVLAGGAIHPEVGFKYAFESGADFLCVGMFDWQVVDDVNIAIDTLSNLSGRQREWYG